MFASEDAIDLRDWNRCLLKDELLRESFRWLGGLIVSVECEFEDCIVRDLCDIADSNNVCTEARGGHMPG